MPLAQRTAGATWSGDLTGGSGQLQFGTGAIPELPITWAARTEDTQGRTSPEELLAAAQAACFAMSLSNGLAKQGHAPERLNVSATCTLDRVEGGVAVTAMAIHVRGQVPGIDETTFKAAAEAAAQGCPVSKAFRGNLDQSLEVDFEG